MAKSRAFSMFCMRLTRTLRYDQKKCKKQTEQICTTQLLCIICIELGTYSAKYRLISSCKPGKATGLHSYKIICINVQ